VVADLRDSVKRGLSRVYRFRDLVRREQKALRTLPMPLRRRVGFWRQGMTTESGLLYDLGNGRRELYLSDWAYAMRTPFINGVQNPTLDDKVVFFHTMRSIGAPTPTVHGLVTERGMAWLDGPPEGEADAQRGVRALLERDGELVLKPATGGRGQGIAFLSRDGPALLVNGAPAGDAALAALLAPGTLVCQRVRQSAWGARIFPGATNTMRLMTMWDLDAGEPFVAVATHRFGTAGSSPVDNVSRGGIAAGIALATGALTAAIGAPAVYGGARLTHHPDTGAPVAGERVPRWDEVVAGVLDACRRIAHVPYIGWDVLVGDDRWWIIEGNHYPDTQVQAFGPLLADPRVRRFYERYGVVRPQG